MGLTTPIPSEVVVSQPRGSNKNRGTSKGSLTRSEGRETGSSPGDVPVPRRRDDSLLSVAPRHPKHENADKHTETNMFPHISSPVCVHRIIYEHSVLSRFPQDSDREILFRESYSHNSSVRNSRPPDSDMRESRVSSSWSVSFVSE